MVFGLNSGTDPLEDLITFAAAFQPTFPILLNASSVYGQYRQSGATSPYPLDYVIDQQGQVAYFSTEYDPEAMIAVIDDLLDQTTPAPDHHEDFPPTPRPNISAQPNPFNPRTILRFEITQPGPLSLTIHDTRGRLVRTLVRGQHFNAGTFNLPWDGTRDDSSTVAAGAYIVRLVTAQGKSSTQMTTTKITLLK